jgi:hypothetical protein
VTHCMGLERVGTKDLVTGLLSDAKELASGQAERMRDEVKDELRNLRHTMMRVAAMVGVMVLAGVLLGHTLAAALVALGLPWWAGYGITALILSAIGLVLLKRLPKDRVNSDLVPEESIEKLRHDFKDIRRSVRQ